MPSAWWCRSSRFRLPELVRAVLSFSRISLAGGLDSDHGRGGRRAAHRRVRDPDRGAGHHRLRRPRTQGSVAGLELGAACYVPYFCVWSPLRLLDMEALLGYVPEHLTAAKSFASWRGSG
jgi:hypothetical protein